MVRRQTYVAGAAIRNFRIGSSLSNRIESERPIRILIESRSFAGPYDFFHTPAAFDALVKVVPYTVPRKHVTTF